MGERTQRLGQKIYERLIDKGANETKASKISRTIADIFGEPEDIKKKDKNPRYIKQLAFISPDEKQLAYELADRAIAGKVELPDIEKIKKKEDRKSKISKLIQDEKLLKRADGAADIAMFGRMLADDPDYNREAAVQIAHAITTNRVVIENDFYTAVDDLKKPSEDAGAGFMGELGFGSGVFYIYACIDRNLLVENLAGDKALAATAITALVEALATASPSGKKNSFAHGGRAEYILAERGDQQPRTLAGAFLHHVRDEDLMSKSVDRLEKYRADMDAAYGDCAEATQVMHIGVKGSLADILSFCTADMESA